ncbi:hypothetical protein [Leifsonia sp. 1010]|uniref:hypothetical protein n=1 Tax=Leifsonia sp. 1010 TaxID=2817769 RepID=UPI0028556B50|nr:hypothetical protein [Leifsonia sp. 1010]MDR6613605.1 hypothetical protein [Leifsonia sp. 1010]
MGKVHAWSLNSERGIALRNGAHFDAQMHYEIIPDEDQGFRVTTKAYRYKLQIGGDIQFMMHWHPTGRSAYELPHLHLPNSAGLDEDTHLPTARFTFEDAVEWTIKITGQSARDDWQQILDETRDRHISHRQWHTRPGEQHAQPPRR